LGPGAELVSLGLVGFGLWAASHFMNDKVPSTAQRGKPLAKEAHA
jgi:hypothetical protein